MTDAELIYNALLRAEKRLEMPERTQVWTPLVAAQAGAYLAVRTMREEIGNGMAERGR